MSLQKEKFDNLYELSDPYFRGIKDHIIFKRRIFLEKWMYSITLDLLPYKGELDNCSAAAFIRAASKWPLNKHIDLDLFLKEVDYQCLNIDISSLIDKGFINLEWDNKKNNFKFNLKDDILFNINDNININDNSSS